MRYIVIFSDKMTKHVSPKAAEIFRQAMKTKGPVDFKGATYAGYSVLRVLPIHQYERDLRESAANQGVYRCPYGYNHPDRSDCGCRDAGFTRVLSQDEEHLLIENNQNVDGISEKSSGLAVSI